MQGSTPASGASSELLNEALRSWYAAFNDLGRQFALHLGMHGSDAAALVQITSAEDRGAPLTQTQLARRIGLTTPATSSLLNRLEESGHIERHRSSADRRVVTVRSTEAMHEQVHAFFREVGEDVDQLVSRRPSEMVDEFTQLVTQMTGVLNQHLQEMVDEHQRSTMRVDGPAAGPGLDHA